MRCVQKSAFGACTRGSSATEWLGASAVLFLLAGTLLTALTGDVEPVVEHLFCRIQKFGDFDQACGIGDDLDDHASLPEINARESRDRHASTEQALFSRPTVETTLPPDPHRAPKLPSGGKLATLAQLPVPREEGTSLVAGVDLGARVAALDDSSFGDGAGTVQVAQAAQEPKRKAGSTRVPITSPGSGSSGGRGTLPELANDNRPWWRKLSPSAIWTSVVLTVFEPAAEPTEIPVIEPQPRFELKLDDRNGVQLVWQPASVSLLGWIWPKGPEIRFATLDNGQPHEVYARVFEENGMLIARRDDGTVLARKAKDAEQWTVPVGVLPPELGARILNEPEIGDAAVLRELPPLEVFGQEYVKVGNWIYVLNRITGDVTPYRGEGASPSDSNATRLASGDGSDRNSGAESGMSEEEERAARRRENNRRRALLADPASFAGWRQEEREGSRQYFRIARETPSAAREFPVTAIDVPGQPDGVATLLFDYTVDPDHTAEATMTVRGTESASQTVEITIDNHGHSIGALREMTIAILREVPESASHLTVSVVGVHPEREHETSTSSSLSIVESALPWLGPNWRIEWDDVSQIGNTLSVRANQHFSWRFVDKPSSRVTPYLDDATVNDIWRFGHVNRGQARRVVDAISEARQARRPLNSLSELGSGNYVTLDTLISLAQSSLRFRGRRPARERRFIEKMSRRELRALDPRITAELAQRMIDAVWERNEGPAPLLDMVHLHSHLSYTKDRELLDILAELDRQGVRIRGTNRVDPAAPVRIDYLGRTAGADQTVLEFQMEWPATLRVVTGRTRLENGQPRGDRTIVVELDEPERLSVLEGAHFAGLMLRQAHVAPGDRVVVRGAGSAAASDPEDRWYVDAMPAIADWALRERGLHARRSSEAHLGFPMFNAVSVELSDDEIRSLVQARVEEMAGHLSPTNQTEIYDRVVSYIFLNAETPSERIDIAHNFGIHGIQIVFPSGEPLIDPEVAKQHRDFAKAIREVDVTPPEDAVPSQSFRGRSRPRAEPVTVDFQALIRAMMIAGERGINREEWGLSYDQMARLVRLYPHVIEVRRLENDGGEQRWYSLSDPFAAGWFLLDRPAHLDEVPLNERRPSGQNWVDLNGNLYSARGEPMEITPIERWMLMSAANRYPRGTTLTAAGLTRRVVEEMQWPVRRLLEVVHGGGVRLSDRTPEEPGVPTELPYPSVRNHSIIPGAVLTGPYVLVSGFPYHANDGSPADSALRQDALSQNLRALFRKLQDAYAAEGENVRWRMLDELETTEQTVRFLQRNLKGAVIGNPKLGYRLMGNVLTQEQLSAPLPLTLEEAQRLDPDTRWGEVGDYFPITAGRFRGAVYRAHPAFGRERTGEARLAVEPEPHERITTALVANLPPDHGLKSHEAGLIPEDLRRSLRPRPLFRIGAFPGNRGGLRFVATHTLDYEVAKEAPEVSDPGPHEGWLRIGRNAWLDNHHFPYRFNSDDQRFERHTPSEMDWRIFAALRRAREQNPTALSTSGSLDFTVSQMSNFTVEYGDLLETQQGWGAALRGTPRFTAGASDEYLVLDSGTVLRADDSQATYTQAARRLVIDLMNLDQNETTVRSDDAPYDLRKAVEDLRASTPDLIEVLPETSDELPEVFEVRFIRRTNVPQGDSQ